MAVAACLGDEDFVYLDEMASKGVAIGVDVELPRVPKVFEEKTSWALEFEEAMWEDVVSDNYPSAKENEKDIKRQVMEEVEAGTIKRLGHKEAVKKFGGRLAVAALGAVPKELNSERVRLIHDGTYSVGVNQRIRVRDRLRFPLIEDAAAILREVRKEAEACRGLIRFSLLYDVSRAHKLVPVREEDWRLLAFKLPGDSGEDIYFHTRGTFGIGSAAYWWQRLASTVVRSAHRLGGDLLALWHLLFADDGWLTATGKMFWQKLLFWLFTLDCLELPLSWKKVAGGAVVQWIGYQLDVKDVKKGISQKKVEWINKWVKEKTAAGGITGRELRAALGRLLVQMGVGAGAEHIRSVSKGGGDSAGLCLQRGQQITDERSQRVSTGDRRLLQDWCKSRAGQDSHWWLGDIGKLLHSECSMVLSEARQEGSAVGIPQGGTLQVDRHVGAGRGALGSDAFLKGREVERLQRCGRAAGAHWQPGHHSCPQKVWLFVLPPQRGGDGISMPTWWGKSGAGS